jgi:hypothetical protein
MKFVTLCFLALTVVGPAIIAAIYDDDFFSYSFGDDDFFAVDDDASFFNFGDDDTWEAFIRLALAAQGFSEVCIDATIELGADFSECFEHAGAFFELDPVDDLPNFLSLYGALNATTFANFTATIENDLYGPVCNHPCFSRIFDGAAKLQSLSCFPEGALDFDATVPQINFACSTYNDIACPAVGEIVYDLTSAASYDYGLTPIAFNTTFDLAVACPILESAGPCVGNSIAYIAEWLELSSAQKQTMVDILVENCESEDVDVSSAATATTAPSVSSSSTKAVVSFTTIAVAVVAFFFN